MANPPADACPPSRAASGAGLQQGTERTPVPRSTRQPPKNHSEEQKARCLPSAARSWCSQHRSPVLGWELGRRRDPFFFFFFPLFALPEKPGLYGRPLPAPAPLCSHREGKERNPKKRVLQGWKVWRPRGAALSTRPGSTCPGRAAVNGGAEGEGG